jgi:hypothetical protein
MIMFYNVSLPPLPGFKGMAWKEGEQPAIILDMGAPANISAIEASFAGNCRAALPDAVYYHARKGKYRVYGLVNYDHCSGGMTFYSKAWQARPPEMSKIIPRGAGAASMAYMPNERAVLLLWEGRLYKIDRYTARVKMALPLAGRAVFAGQNIYVAEGAQIKEYSPGGSFLKAVAPALSWAAEINSGAVNHREGTILVCSATGRMAVISQDRGDKIAEGVFDKRPADYTLAGYNGELLMVAGNRAKKLYWLDRDFNEVASADYGEALPGSPLISFDGRDILALDNSGGRLYTCNIQDNWAYAGVAYTASPGPGAGLPAKLPDIDNLYILYSEFNWDKDRVKSVLGYLDSHKRASGIMFDGLLMMAQTCHGKSLMGERPAAGPPEWGSYLDRLMKEGGRYELAHLAAAEIQAEALLPGYKPRVFIGLPSPMDRWERYRWFMDCCIRRAACYRNVMLAGFYHMEEFKADAHGKKIKDYLDHRGLGYIWSPGYPAGRSIKKHRGLFDAVFYQTGYPWGYKTAPRGKERELTLALDAMIRLHVRPNVESMNDTRWFTFTRDKAYTLWDILLNYGVYGTTSLHFTGDSQVPESCFSANPFERELYDLYHEFLRGRRTPGRARPLYNREKDYSLALPEAVAADKIRIMPRFTRNPPSIIPRTLLLEKCNVIPSPFPASGPPRP